MPSFLFTIEHFSQKRTKMSFLFENQDKRN
jgi:hypothetical protein